MIDNVLFLITGNLHGRTNSELAKKCDPLGSFHQIGSTIRDYCRNDPILGTINLELFPSPAKLFKNVIIDTPLAPFFKRFEKEEDWSQWSELNIEFTRSLVAKAYLESFFDFCKVIGGETAKVMCELLAFEADRRAFIITINSFGTELENKRKREAIYPACGKLTNWHKDMLSSATDYEQVRAVAEYFSDYSECFEEAGTGMPGERTLEDKFYECEVRLNMHAFMKQFHFGVFYSYLKLREQECRNVAWIAECIVLRNKTAIDNYIPIPYMT